jgi:RNA polymerase sigma factor (TIGR02999 family)
MAQPPGNVTILLAAAGDGDDEARNRLFTLLYQELHRLAHRKLDREGPACDRQTTSLVHDLFIKLAGGECLSFANRLEFFGSAARAMEQILVEDARKRLAEKRGGGKKPIHLEFDPLGRSSNPAEILDVHEALKKLEAVDARKAEVVRHRFFAGMTGEESAEALGVSARSVDSDWQFSRAWLHRELGSSSSIAG